MTFGGGCFYGPGLLLAAGGLVCLGASVGIISMGIRIHSLRPPGTHIHPHHIFLHSIITSRYLWRNYIKILMEKLPQDIYFKVNIRVPLCLWVLVSTGSLALDTAFWKIHTLVLINFIRYLWKLFKFFNFNGHDQKQSRPLVTTHKLFIISSSNIIMSTRV